MKNENLLLRRLEEHGGHCLLLQPQWLQQHAHLPLTNIYSAYLETSLSESSLPQLELAEPTSEQLSLRRSKNESESRNQSGKTEMVLQLMEAYLVSHASALHQLQTSSKNKNKMMVEREIIQHDSLPPVASSSSSSSASAAASSTTVPSDDVVWKWIVSDGYHTMAVVLVGSTLAQHEMEALPLGIKMNFTFHPPKVKAIYLGRRVLVLSASQFKQTVRILGGQVGQWSEWTYQARLRYRLNMRTNHTSLETRFQTPTSLEAERMNKGSSFNRAPTSVVASTAVAPTVAAASTAGGGRNKKDTTTTNSDCSDTRLDTKEFVASSFHAQPQRRTQQEKHPFATFSLDTSTSPPLAAPSPQLMSLLHLHRLDLNTPARVKAVITAIESRLEWQHRRQYECRVRLSDGQTDTSVRLSHDLLTSWMGVTVLHVQQALQRQDPHALRDVQQRIRRVEQMLAQAEGVFLLLKAEEEDPELVVMSMEEMDERDVCFLLNQC